MGLPIVCSGLFISTLRTFTLPNGSSCWNSVSLSSSSSAKPGFKAILEVLILMPRIIWATSWENLFLPYANNKGADQPVHVHSLISAFVVPCLDRSYTSICYSRNFKTLASSAGWFESYLVSHPEDRFSRGSSKKQLKVSVKQTKKNYLSHHMSKQTKWPMRPAKTQISLGICPVWSQSSLSAWKNLGILATHWAHSKQSDQTGRISGWSESSLGAHHFVGFVMQWLISFSITHLWLVDSSILANWMSLFPNLGVSG